MRAALIAALIFMILPALAQDDGGIGILLQCDLSANLMRGAQIGVPSSASTGAKYAGARMVDEDASARWASSPEQTVPVQIAVTLPEERTLDTLVLLVTDLPKLYATFRRVSLSFPDGERVGWELEDRGGAHIIRFPERTVRQFTLSIDEAWQQRMYFGIDELLAFHDPQGQVQRTLTTTERWLQADVTPRGREEHPCVYINREDVAHARRQIERHPWAAEHARTVIARADEVVGHGPEWIREMCPPAGALFAMGQSGCPICGARWGTWGNADCSFDRPGTVRCSNGHILPDAEHPDDGSGWVGPDGRTFWFVGSYYTWVVETYQSWCHDLAFAYTITGDDCYARTCAALLDALAEIYPTCLVGAAEYPPSSGRLTRPSYQTARVLVTLVHDYDRIFHSPSLDEPSFVDGLSRRANIEKNMLENGAWYCYTKSFEHPSLNNGNADFVRGALAVGCVLGIEHYIDWGADGPFGVRALVDNNVDRDGRYMETALGYSNHSRELYLTFTEPLMNVQSERYPDGLNLYDDPHFRSFYLLPTLAMDCAGHMPRFGDAGTDTSRIVGAPPLSDARDLHFAQYIANRTTDAQAREQFGAIVRFVGGEDGGVEEVTEADREWLLFHSQEPTGAVAEAPEAILRRLTEPVLFGQKGLAILRTPHGPQTQAALLRWGPSVKHGQFDDLNLNYYALGWEVTYDIGYGWANTNTQVGWADQTASHNLVMVNESNQRPSGEDGTGGSLRAMAAMPGLSLVDADANGVYRSQGVESYRRMIALIGEGPGSYLLDLFTVAGGHQHDYLMHALSDQVAFEGVTISERAEGSLAGPEINYGERQLPDGFIAGLERRNYWAPPPENGFGFLMHPRRGTPEGAWSATWTLPSGEDRFRLTMPAQEGVEVVNAWAPGITPTWPRAEYVMVRRSGAEGLRSTFAAVLEPIGAQHPRVGLSATELLAAARTGDGTLKHVPTQDGVLLFQANEVGGRAEITLTAPEAGEYRLHIRPCLSPAYGSCRFLLDGQPVVEQWSGRGDVVRAAEAIASEPIALAAGEHTLTIETIAGEGANPWIGIISAGLVPSDAAEAAEEEPQATIGDVRRLPAPEGVTALEVERAEGAVDRFLYRPEGAGEFAAGAMRADATFAAMQSDGDRPLAAYLVGRSLAAPGIELTLERAGWSGSVLEVDYDRRVVWVDADLPEDGRLVGQPVVFNNELWSCNSPYAIHGIIREGGRTGIFLGPQRIELGRGTVEQVGGATLLLSATPHDLTEGGGRRFMDGKLVASGDRSVTSRITEIVYTHPFEVHVASTEGFAQGDLFRYLDLAPGDSFAIANWASVRIKDGQPVVTATDDVTLTLDGRTTQVPWQ